MASSNGNAAIPLHSNRAYALAYAKKGYPVFPLHSAMNGVCTCGKQCGNAGKHPRTKNGLKDATTDPAKINAWWSDNPDAPIGIVCGDAQNLLVIDIDPRNGGNETWDRLTMEHGPIATVRVKTGGGGEHLYLKAPRTPIKSRGNALGPGVDISSNGHYIVAPPSLHASGSRYEFAPEAGLADIDPADCPYWVVELASRPRAKQRRTASSDTRGWIAVAFDAAGRLGKWNAAAGAWHARCPWEHEHSDGRGNGEDSSAVVFPPDGDRTMGWFHCSHAHCSTRSLDDVRRALPDSARAEADKVYPPPRTPPHDPVTGEVPSSQDAGTDWQTEFSRKPDGSLVACMANALLIVTNDPAWSGVLAFDDFAGRHVYRKPAPWDADSRPGVSTDRVRADDGNLLHVWLHRHWHVRVPIEQCSSVLRMVAERSTFHPVRDWLSSLAWDGTIRLPTFPSVYLGAEDTAYHRAIFSRWMIAAVARIYRPGCQVDNALILEGEQGRRKTRAIQVLVGDDWYANGSFDLRNYRQAAEAIQGRWVVEMGELASMARADVETWKNFSTIRIDHYQRPYGKEVEDRPRQCIFAGTTNQRQYLTDETGARRNWGLRIGDARIDTAPIERDREQLWAEAVVRFQAGEQWWLTDEEEPLQVDEQEQRRIEDTWEARIAAWLATTGEPVTVERVLRECMTIDTCDQQERDRRRAAQAMRLAGWEQTRQLGPRGARVKIWEVKA